MITQVKEREASTLYSLKAEARKPFGLTYPELLFLCLALIGSIGVGIYYYSTLSHEQSDMNALRRQIASLSKAETDLKAASNVNKQAQEDLAKTALESLESFKSVYLKNLSQGRIALIEAINNLAKKDGVRLMSGIAMTANKTGADSSGDKKNTKKKGAESLGSVFPSLKINFTVAGEYKNLREFINDVEANKQFVTINSITLTSIKEREGGSVRSGGRRTAQVASGISLAIDMTAYFQS